MVMRSVFPSPAWMWSLWSLLLFLPWQTYAQGEFRPGYVLTLSQDTLWGYVSWKRPARLGRLCHFKSTIKGEKKRFTPEEIRGYGFQAGKVFYAEAVTPEKKAFVECFFEGALSFYYLRDSVDYYFVRKAAAELIPLINTEQEIKVQGKLLRKENREYQEVLIRLMQRPELTETIARTPLHKNSLIRLGERYHALVSPELTHRVVRKEGDTFRIRPELVVGAFSKQPYLAPFLFQLPINPSQPDRWIVFGTGQKYRDQWHPTAGLIFTLENLPYLSDRVSLRLGVTWYQFGPGEFVPELNIQLFPDPASAFRLPIEVGYRLGKGRLYTTLSAGAALSYYTGELNIFPPRALMGLAGAGLHLEGKSWGRISLRGRYEMTSGAFLCSLGLGL